MRTIRFPLKSVRRCHAPANAAAPDGSTKMWAKAASACTATSKSSSATSRASSTNFHSAVNARVAGSRQTNPSAIVSTGLLKFVDDALLVADEDLLVAVHAL